MNDREVELACYAALLKVAGDHATLMRAVAAATQEAGTVPSLDALLRHIRALPAGRAE